MLVVEVINDLVGFDNYKIYQDTDMFNFSLDSILLPNFVTLNKKTKKILDIGCGNAPIPLVLSTKTKAKVIGIEIQSDVYKLACKTIKLNKLEEQIEIVNADINEVYKNYENESFDTIVCNPPFFKLTETSRLNNNDFKSYARHEIALNLKQLFKIAKYLLKTNGNIAIVHRPERLVDIVDSMLKNGIQPKRIRFVYPKINSDSNCLLIEGTKNGKSGIKVLKPIYVHNEDGTYSEEVKKYFK